jgi:uncharacterized RmlC-like cupin family protein
MKYASVKDLRIMKVKGPWTTKSGGELSVLMALNSISLKEFVGEPGEISRGLRLYTVGNLPKNKEGGREFHREREEIIFSLKGEISFLLEDLFGDKFLFVLKEGEDGIWIPPFILHTYKALKENSALLVIANTLFDPDDKTTHDTYSKEVFEGIKEDLPQKTI